MESWIKERSHVYVRRGGKQARRAQIRLLISACSDIANHEHGVKSPAQIGRAHIHRYYARKQVQGLSAKTMQAHYYAIKVLWQVLLKRSSEPPRPKSQ